MEHFLGGALWGNTNPSNTSRVVESYKLPPSGGAWNPSQHCRRLPIARQPYCPGRLQFHLLFCIYSENSPRHNEVLYLITKRIIRSGWSRRRLSWVAPSLLIYFIYTRSPGHKTKPTFWFPALTRLNCIRAKPGRGGIMLEVENK